MKKCKKCGIEKDEEEFYNQANKSLKIGKCKKCHNEIMKKWQKDNPEKTRKAFTKFNRKRNKGRICKYCGQIYKIANAQLGCSLKCRFELAVDRKENECWHWIKGKGGKKGSEYGHIWINGKCKIASRISYEIHKGDIPEGMMVLHICDNSICVNPNHLYLGNHQKNMDDMNNRGRGNKGRIHYKKYTKEQCKEVFRLRGLGMIYKEISHITKVKDSMCKYICKKPERISWGMGSMGGN